MPAASASCLLRAVSFGSSAKTWSLRALTFIAMICRTIAGGRCPFEFLPMDTNAEPTTDPVPGCGNPKSGLQFGAMPAESIYQFVLDRLKADRPRWAEIAEGSGVPLRSLEKIGREEWTNPGVHNIDKLAQYFRRESAQLRKVAR